MPDSCRDAEVVEAMQDPGPVDQIWVWNDLGEDPDICRDKHIAAKKMPASCRRGGRPCRAMVPWTKFLDWNDLGENPDKF